MFTIDKHKLRFSHKFNEPICRNIIEIIKGNNITEIIFGWDFNQLIDNLPNGIKNIIFCSYYYDLPIDNLPNTIELIKLSKYFDHPLDNLPDSIHTIYFGEYFNQRLDNLPISIKNLYFPITGQFNRKFINLPENLEILLLPRNYSKRFDNVPNSMIKLNVHNNYPHCNDLKKIVPKREILNYYNF